MQLGNAMDYDFNVLSVSFISHRLHGCEIILLV